MPKNEESRIPKDPATSTPPSAEHDHTERCRRCRRPIWAQRSVSRHAGPVCHRELVAAA